MNTAITLNSSSSMAHSADVETVLSGDVLAKEIRKAREARRYYEDFIVQARAMDEASATARVAFDLLDWERHSLLGTSSAQWELSYLQVDMARRADANAFYDQALQAADPALYPTIKAALPDMAWMYAPSYMGNLLFDELDPVQDARSVRLK